MIYIVYIATGVYDDYHEEIVFATHDEEYAKSWVGKYNRIVQEHQERKIELGSGSFQWDWFIDHPIAKYHKTETR